MITLTVKSVVLEAPQFLLEALYETEQSPSLRFFPNSDSFQLEHGFTTFYPIIGLARFETPKVPELMTHLY